MDSFPRVGHWLDLVGLNGAIGRFVRVRNALVSGFQIIDVDRNHVVGHDDQEPAIECKTSIDGLKVRSEDHCFAVDLPPVEEFRGKSWQNIQTLACEQENMSL